MLFGRERGESADRETSFHDDLEDMQISLKLRGQRKSEVAPRVPPSEQGPNYYLAGK